MSDPQVSVVIATYNRGYCIGQAVNSVLTQTFRDYELIVVNDGSTDETLRVLQAYGDQIRIIDQENRGVSAARNRGIANARGEWVAFLDSDDEWEPEKLERQMACAAQYDDLAMISCDALIQDLHGQWHDIFKLCEDVDSWGITSYRPRPLCRLMRCGMFTSGMVYRRALLHAVGGYDEDISVNEDNILSYKVAVQGPLGVVGLPLARIARKGDPTQALMQIAKSGSQVRQWRKLTDVYHELLTGPRANAEEKKALRRAISDLFYVIAKDEIKNESWLNGFHSLLASLRTGRQARDLLRVAAILIIGVHRVERYRAHLRQGDLVER